MKPSLQSDLTRSKSQDQWTKNLALEKGSYEENGASERECKTERLLIPIQSLNFDTDNCGEFKLRLTFGSLHTVSELL
jgi:hypothetical protein